MVLYRRCPTTWWLLINTEYPSHRWPQTRSLFIKSTQPSYSIVLKTWVHPWFFVVVHAVLEIFCVQYLWILLGAGEGSMGSTYNAVQHVPRWWIGSFLYREGMSFKCRTVDRSQYRVVSDTLFVHYLPLLYIFENNQSISVLFTQCLPFSIDLWLDRIRYLLTFFINL